MLSRSPRADRSAATLARIPRHHPAQAPSGAEACSSACATRPRTLGLAALLVGLGVFSAPTEAVTLFGSDVLVEELLTIDSTTGAATTVGAYGPNPPPFSAMLGLAFDVNSDTLYGSDTNSGNLVTIDPATADVTIIGALGQAVRGLAFDPNTSTLFGVAINGAFSNLLTVDTGTGAATLVNPPQDIGFTGVESLAFDASSDTLFGLSNGSFIGDPQQLITIDPLTGIGTAVGGIVGGGFPSISGLTVGADGLLYGSDSLSDELLTLDTTTGAGTLVGAFGAGHEDVHALAAPAPAAAPEPASVLLLGAGVIALVSLGRRARG